MGKKSKKGGGGGGGEQKVKATEMVLKVAMHCNCDGCKDKIRNGVRELALVPGVEAVDKSALETKGEVRLVATTANPEKLRHRLHKVTGKKVDLAVILPPQPKPAAAVTVDNAEAAALLAALQRQAQAQAQAAAAAGVYGNGWNTAAWGALQQQQPEYYYSPAAYPHQAVAYHQQLGHGGGVSPWYPLG
uniref:HMA domain-containing protein n=1 Tax=Leersia perrieri TaxID=77586 RepID=A0A0D9VMQ7_9ORYZ